MMKTTVTGSSCLISGSDDGAERIQSTANVVVPEEEDGRGWETYFDLDSGKPYYHHPASQRTTWALPHESLDPAFPFVVLLETLTEDQDNMVKHITGGGPTLRYKTLRYTESKSSK